MTWTYRRTCMCTRVKINSAPHVVKWQSTQNQLVHSPKKIWNFSFGNKTNCTHEIQRVEKDAQSFFIQQMGRGGRHRVLGGTSLLSKFWDDPPSLPLSERATRRKLNKCCHFDVLMCSGFCFGSCFLVCPKTKQTKTEAAWGNKIEFLFKKLSTRFFGVGPLAACSVLFGSIEACWIMGGLRGLWEAYGDSKLYNTNVEVPARLTWSTRDSVVGNCAV